MRVTTKGQVTIPKEIRDHLGIEPGSEVEFVSGPQGVQLVAVNTNVSREEEIRQFREALQRSERMLDLKGMTADEYFEWIRGPRAEVDPG